MTWLTWRQQRSETVLTAALVAALAVFVLVTGLHMRHEFARLALAACSDSSPTSACGAAIDQFDRRFSALGTILGWLNFLPAVIGVAFAVPIVLELEHGTYRLSWTQSVTRRRWIAVKIGGAAVAAVTAALVVSLLITWWRGPWDHLSGRWEANTAFNFEGVVPYAYTLFALALALALGTATRRIGVVVIGTLVAFPAVRLPIQFWARPHYLAPLHRLVRGDVAPPDSARDWVLSQGFTNLKATTPALYERSRQCFDGPHSALLGCLRHLGFVESFTYQPASRFWLFQAIEAGIFLVPAAALVALAAWWIERRVS